MEPHFELNRSPQEERQQNLNVPNSTQPNILKLSNPSESRLLKYNILILKVFTIKPRPAITSCLYCLVLWAVVSPLGPESADYEFFDQNLVIKQ